MSGFSENDVQRAAEIREWLTKEISDKEEELDRLRKMLWNDRCSALSCAATDGYRQLGSSSPFPPLGLLNSFE